MATKAQFPYHMEIIDGKEREKALPCTEHALVQIQLLEAFLQANIADRYFIMPELNVACGKDGHD